MQRLSLLIAAISYMLAAAACVFVGSLVSDYFEHRSTQEIQEAFLDEGHDWATVRADGLIIYVSGPAPNEAARFQTLNVVGDIVDSSRIRDGITVLNALASDAPRFTLEMLRNGDGISLIGLVPEATDRAYILESLEGISAGVKVTDMLETADHVVPEGWDAALAFGLDSLSSLPRSKISVMSTEVKVAAISDSPEEKKRIEGELARNKPDGVRLVMEISSPRPVITPFSLRLIMDANGTRFDSCSADTEASRDRIIAAASAAGLSGKVQCTIGLGVPTPRWAEAVEAAITALQELGGGNLTFADADITLVAEADTPQSTFDRVVHNFEVALPDVFSLHAILPPKPIIEGDAGDVELPEFSATKSPEGLVQLRGRVRDERTKTSVGNYAKALFGSENVYDTTRVDPSLPDGWPVRVLAGLEALGKLHNGSLLVQPDIVEVRGVADVPEATSEVTSILSVKLGDASQYKMFVRYEEALNKRAQLPTPQECIDSINAVLAEKQIAFAPGSTTIEEDSMDVVEKIAELMLDCSEVRMEIGGHTDSQGREMLNQTISQARAEAVLDALLRLEILTKFLEAKGYGEAEPIADNKTEEGRTANRRIQFKLIEATDETTDAAASDTQTDAVPTESHDTGAPHGQD